MLAGATQFPGRDDLWLVDGVVIRRHDNTAEHTIAWIHRVLEQLDFNAPKPVNAGTGAASMLSMRKVMRLEPAIVFKG